MTDHTGRSDLGRRLTLHLAYGRSLTRTRTYFCYTRDPATHALDLGSRTVIDAASSAEAEARMSVQTGIPVKDIIAVRVDLL